MGDRSKIPVKIHSRDRRDRSPQDGYLEVVSWSKPERVRNAVRSFGMWIGIAFGCALIPFWHFLLVPVAVMLAFTVALKKLEEQSSVQNGTGLCPECKAPLKIEGGTIKQRTLETCARCFHSLEIKTQTED